MNTGTPSIGSPILPSGTFSFVPPPPHLVVELFEQLELRPTSKPFEVELHCVTRGRPGNTRNRLRKPLEELFEVEPTEPERRPVRAEPCQHTHVGISADNSAMESFFALLELRFV